MEGYNALMEKAFSELPETAKEKARFKMPVFESFIQGNQTIIQNFTDVTGALRRDEKHLMKFLSKELATPADLDGRRLILKGKHRDKTLNGRLEKYVKEYVLCTECGKPDTNLLTQGGVNFMRCEACGARSPVSVIK
ncbi:MAG: translation initiation factor IF-2 subunit beta [Candidatus Diapherotrites archaeon]|nr:translation initiation factor IF-2 subunit beta [Candidatus Diapherotrites archaeon]